MFQRKASKARRTISDRDWNQRSRLEWPSPDRPNTNQSSEHLREPSTICTSGMQITFAMLRAFLTLKNNHFQDLANLGSSWIFPISKSAPRQTSQNNVLGNSKSPFFRTSCGNVNRSLLQPTTGYKEMLPTGEIFTGNDPRL